MAVSRAARMDSSLAMVDEDVERPMMGCRAAVAGFSGIGCLTSTRL